MIREHESEVDGLRSEADVLKEQLKAVEKASQDNMTGHNSEIAEIKRSIVNVKNDFLMTIYGRKSSTHAECAGKYESRSEQNSWRRIRHSLDSIEYNIKNIKNCGLFARLFGLC